MREGGSSPAGSGQTGLIEKGHPTCRPHIPLQINMEPPNYWVVEENRLPRVNSQVLYLSLWEYPTHFHDPPMFLGSGEVDQRTRDLGLRPQVFWLKKTWGPSARTNSSP